MSIAEIRKIMNPRSVAIYGASDDISKWGGGLMHLVKRHGWQGMIYPISRKDYVQGLRAYPDIGSIPEPIDVACIAVPGEQVAQVVAECADKGVTGCLIISSNFAEVGEEGARRQQEIVDIARARGTRLIGPNCMGLMNTHASFNICNSSAAEIYADLPKGPVGVASQSGALLGTMLARAYECGVGFSSGVSLGNQADLEICDFFEYLIEDENTQIICLYIEGLQSPDRFRTLCRRSITSGKPVLLVKAGRSDAGAHAVLSHTGSLAGGYDNLAAVCRQLGVLLLTDVIEMINAAAGWVTLGGWSQGGIAVTTASGGGGALAMDALEEAGFSLPTLGSVTQEILARWAPPTHLQLPLDVGVIGAHSPATAINQALRESLTAIMADPSVGAGVYVMTTQKHAELCVQAVIDTARTCGKPYLLINLASEVGHPIRRILRDAGLLEVSSLASAVSVLSALREIHTSLQPRPQTVDPTLLEDLASQIQPTGDLPVTLTEAETKNLLSLAGLPVPKQALARSAEDAARYAEAIGLPVVLKIDASGVSHKSDMGGVVLNLRTPEEVREAYSRIQAAADQKLEAGQMRGCLVQQMVPGDVELIVGARWDPDFGTMVVFGIGGTLVELLHDIRILPTPFSREEVREELKKLRLYPLLTGYRGSTAVDLDRIVDTIVDIGRFAQSLGPRLLEFDANPVRVSADAVCIADARAVIH